ncbi:hypothetical protein C2G38_2156579 [Gigaspora rosea]|uniref:Uncharacterized protein n=1 Tax=Gigaspora rosea TaxID=44941 RepID=A0A397W6M7_9GLOM|nr:hypothetical protein C2G38_2156579 [Gigaspora rosea]
MVMVLSFIRLIGSTAYKEFLYKVSSEYKEVYDEFSQEFDTSIEHEIYNETLMFDHHSLKNLQEIITQLINKSDNELFESDDEVLQNDDKTEIFEEFEQLVPSIPNRNVKTAHCVIVDNDNDDNIIQKCTEPGEHYLRQLSTIDNIDLKDATFQYSNIFDVVYNTIHAIAQMVFQYQYFELVNLDNNIRNYPPFGQTFDSDHIVKAIKANIDSTLFVNPLSKDKHVYKAVKMF